MTAIGFIGAGRVATQHAAAIEAAGGVIGAVYDLDVLRARTFAAEHGGVVAGTLEDLLAADVELVLVLSPAATHMEHALAAVSAGKHVLVEKPVSWDAEEIVRLDVAARAAGVVCVPGHNSIYLPEVERIHRVLVRGDLGSPVALQISETYRMPDELARRYRGPLEEVLIHHVYTALYLLGRPDEVVAMAASPLETLPVDPQHLAVIARWDATGTLAQLYQSWAGDDHTAAPRTHRVNLLGTAGGVTFSRRDVVGELEPGGNPTTPLYQELFDNQAHHLLVRQLGNGEPALSTMADAADAASVIAAVRESLHSGRAVRPEYVGAAS